MMNKLIGIGTDIIEVSRIEQSLQNHYEKFVERIFTPHEIAYCEGHKNAPLHFAGRFAAKEAISKALGTGFGKELSWLDIEIMPNFSGKPIVTVKKQQVHIELSISHCKAYAVASAIAYE